jgi:hypothetical protein
MTIQGSFSIVSLNEPRKHTHTHILAGWNSDCASIDNRKDNTQHHPYIHIQTSKYACLFRIEREREYNQARIN